LPVSNPNQFTPVIRTAFPLESTIWFPLVERYPVELTGVETGVGLGVAAGEGEADGVGVGVAEGLGTGVGDGVAVGVGAGVAVGLGTGVGVGWALDPPEVSENPAGGVFTFPGLPIKPKEALPPGGIELCQE
jgi:hypothetical protein